MSLVPVWNRPAHTKTTAVAEVVLLAFAPGKLDLSVPMKAGEHGAVSNESLDAVQVTSYSRSRNPEWFDNWRTGALRVVAERDLGSLSPLDEATQCYRIASETADPADLSSLQASWAYAHYLSARGSSVLLDLMAGQYLPASTVRDWQSQRAFDITREVTITFEVDARWDGRHLVHTRGMRKFARPDLIALVEAEQGRAAGDLLNALALAQAEGHVLHHGQRVTVPGVGRAQLTSYVAGRNAPEIELGNEALLARLVLERSGA